MKQKGFSLIELMIAVAILGILVAIAYPSYVDYVRDGRRAEAMGDMLELAQWMERQFTVDGRYTDSDGDTRTLPFTTSPRSGTAYYNLTAVSTNGSNFTLTATPTTNGGQNNDECGTLTLSNIGVKTASGSGDCWD